MSFKSAEHVPSSYPLLGALLLLTHWTCSFLSSSLCPAMTSTERSSSVQFTSVAQSCLTLWPHGLQHARLPCPSPTPGAYSNSCPLSRWCHPTISSSVIPFSSSVIPFSSCVQSFPALGSFPMNQFFHLVAKVLEFQLQHQSFQWIFRVDLLLDWLVWSCSPRDSQDFSSTTVQKHQFFGTRTFQEF